MYTKALSSLLRMLQTSKQSGRLFVEASGPGDSPWQGLFHFDNGIVVSCLLLDKASGRVVLRNDEALRWLTGQEKLEWRMDEVVPPPGSLLPVPPPGEGAREVERRKEVGYEHEPMAAAWWKSQLGTIPQRTQKGKVVPVNAFNSREHRQIFALIDGQRTIEEIVQLLSKSPGAVLRVLQELRASGFIV